jgi:hypothetical protein
MTLLRNTIAERQVRDPANQARLGLMVTRVWRLKQRLEALYNRFRTGTLPARRAQPSRAGQAAKPWPARVYVSGKRAWLVAICGWQTAGAAGQLQHWLTHPDMPNFLAVAPQAGRHLRPLLHALGLQCPDYLKLPPRPRKPRVPKASPKPGRPRQTPERGFTRAQIDQMSAADLRAHYGRLPPHANLPIPNLNYIRRKIGLG